MSESVAFVGLGHMGSHMCSNLCTAGFALSAFDLDAAAVRRAVRSGARGAETLADCLSGASVLVTERRASVRGGGWGSAEAVGLVGPELQLTKEGVEAVGKLTRNILVNFPIDREIAVLAGRQQGHVTRKQLLDLGLTPAEIDYRIKLGRLIPVYRGVYAVGHRRTEPLARLKAAVLAGGPGAVASFSSAALLWGLTRRLAPPLELTVSGDRRIDGIRVHRSLTLGNRDITTQRGIRTTSPARTLLDIAPRYTDDDLDRAVNDARHCGFLNLSDLDELLYRLPSAPAAERLRPFVETSTGITRSRFEDAFLRFARHFGLPTPEINVYVAGHLVDAYFPEHNLIVELDSWEFHGDRGTFESDRERDAAALAHGIVTVRITWARLTGLSEREANRLKQILAARQPGVPAPSSSANRPSSGPSDRR